MFWFILPVVVAGVVAVAAAGSDDEKTSNHKDSSDKKKRALSELKSFKKKEKARLEKKHKLCNNCISFPSDFRASYSGKYFIYKEQKHIEELHKEIATIDQILIEIKSLEEQYDRFKSSK